VFERFSDRARSVLVLAHVEARLLGHEVVGTEHLLVALLREEALAAQALEAQGLDLEAARAACTAFNPPPTSATASTSLDGRSPSLPFTAGAKRTLELALRQSLKHRHRRIRTEHLLLGLCELSGEPSARIIADAGSDVSAVTGAVLELMELGCPEAPGTTSEWVEAASRSVGEPVATLSRPTPAIDSGPPGSAG